MLTLIKMREVHQAEMFRKKFLMGIRWKRLCLWECGERFGSSGQVNDLINNVFFMLASLTQNTAFDTFYIKARIN